MGCHLWDRTESDMTEATQQQQQQQAYVRADFPGDRGIKHLELMVGSRVVKSLIKRMDLRLLPLKALGERGTCT